MRQPQPDKLDIDPERIVLFCSTGSHFEAAIRDLRRWFPRAKLTAVAPAWRTESLSDTSVIDGTIEMPKDKLHLLGDLGECARLITAIRKGKCDLFVTMYESRALNMLHSLVGSRYHAVYNTRGVLSPLKIGRLYAVRLIFGGVWRYLVGCATYVLIKMILFVWGLAKKARLVSFPSRNDR